MANPPNERLHYLDAARAFALLLGIAFHAALSFLPFPVPWIVNDTSGSLTLTVGIVISHSFRMELFFLLAGFFSHLIFHRKGAGVFLKTRLVRIGIPFIAGWFLLRPLIVAAYLFQWPPGEEQFGIIKSLIAGYWTTFRGDEGYLVGTHLWFLYYLLLITATFLILRGVFIRLIDQQGTIRENIDSHFRALANSRYFMLPLVALTVIPLWFMQGWEVDTPDQTLVPSLPIMIVYGWCFALGWLMHRNKELLVVLSRLTWGRGVWLFLAILISLALGTQQFNPEVANKPGLKFVHHLGYCTMMWLMLFGTIGVFRKYFSQPKAWVRYLSDSSYWLYLGHIPLVMWLQVWVFHWNLHWTIEFSFVVIATLIPLFFSYHFLVRGTFIGKLLNGRRKQGFPKSRASTEKATELA